MIYPVNIFSPDPVTGGIRPFMIFLPHKVEHNVLSTLAYGVTKDMLSPRLPFVLPMPNGGLQDGSTNQYAEEPSGLGEVAVAAGKFISGGVEKLSGIGNGAEKMGLAPDPRLTQTYMGTSSRQFTGTWQMIPQSLGESIACMAILGWVKYCAAPDRAGSDKVGILLQPYVFKIIFGNPILHFAMSLDQMAIESYSINYFAQGYASTYKDMMPKHMELTMTFKEYGIKTKEDWLPF